MRTAFQDDSLRRFRGVASAWATGTIPRFFIDVPSSQKICIRDAVRSCTQTERE
jgi:hypothetical protein